MRAAVVTFVATTTLAVELTNSSLTARMQIATLTAGRLNIPRQVKYVLLEAGCSDMDTLMQDVLPSHPEGFTLSLEPLLDKYSFHMGNASAQYHGMNGIDMASPLGHASRRAVMLPLAVSEAGGLQTIHVSPVAGCS